MESILAAFPPPYDVRISYGPETSQFAELRVPHGSGPHPVVAVIHGGFWRSRYDLTHIGHLCAALTRQGCATWSIEYRRLGEPGGGFPGTFQDVSAGLEFLRGIAEKHKLDLGHLVTLGHSAGGHLALWAAARHRVPPDSPIVTPDPLPVRAVVALAGVVDLRRAFELRLSSGVTEQFLGGDPVEYPERYDAASPIELLPLGIAQFLIHGTADDSVPFEISQRYVSSARALGDPVSLVTLPGVGHFELIDPSSDVWRDVAETVRQALQ